VTSQIVEGNIKDEDALKLVQQCLNSGFNLYGTFVRPPDVLMRRLGVASAKQIMNNSWNMSTNFVVTAIRVAGNKEPAVRPVWQIAEEENWFAG
jgi:hypothetical protein